MYKKNISKLNMIFLLLVFLVLFSPNKVKAKDYTNVTDLFNGKNIGNRIIMALANQPMFTTGSMNPGKFKPTVFMTGNKYLYCIHHSASSVTGPYTVTNAIDIEGTVATNLATNKTVSSKANARLSYILSKQEGYGGYNNYSQSQRALYRYYSTWYSAVGSKLKLDSDMNVSNGGISGGDTILNDSVTYANSLGSAGTVTTKPTDRTDKSILTSIPTGSGYKVGPFKWTFSGKISDVKVYGKSGATIKIKSFLTYEGTTEKTIKQGEIKSGQAFYIIVSATDEEGQIAKITGTVTGDSGKVIYNTQIRFLKYGSAAQEIIAAKTTKKSESGQANFTFKYKTLTFGVITKYVKNTDKEVIIKGIKFGYKAWEPDIKKYKTKPVVPKRTDSKYYDSVTRSRTETYTYTVIKKDKNGKKIKVKKTGTRVVYWTEQVFNSSRYQADYNEYLIWKENYEYYINSLSNYVATGVSNKNGEVILSGDIRQGTYQLWEISSSNTYFDVREHCVESSYRPGTQLDIENERTYVDIEGNVFLDGHEGKKSELNNKFDEEEGINGVKVTLKKGSEIISIASGTDSKGASCEEGHYKFWGDRNNLKIRTDELSKYNIEFEYNGLKYESIPKENLDIGEGNGSKAVEKETDRTNFNTGYSQITANKKISGGTSSNLATKNGQSIEYKSIDHISEVLYKASDPKYDDTYYADYIYHIKANTREAGLDLSKTGRIDGYPYDPSNNSIEDINLGIYEREHPDVAITTDLDTVETSINGYTQIYPYQKRYGQMKEGSAFTVEVKKSDAYYPSYQRELYKSDVLYTQTVNDGSELAIYLTYKVAIKNQSPSINVTVSDIVNYFTKDVTEGIVAIGKTPGTLKEIPSMKNKNRYELTEVDGIQYSKIEEDSGYSKQYITLNKEIKTGDKYEFYVQYKMTLDAVRKTIEGVVNFNNVFELNTVSARTTDGKVWTAVDNDSAVGNCLPGDKQTMEDDTDYAPGIGISVSDSGEREINGKVFEDSTQSEFLENQIRKGDGKYGEGDTLISNVKIELVDIDRGTTAKVYLTAGGQDAIYTSSDSGYNISGFIPGNYLIKYTYGKGTGKYTAQQYKSTIYVDEERGNRNYGGYRDGISLGNKYWYLENEYDTYSDAIDNYDGEIEDLYKVDTSKLTKTRMQIDSQWNEEDGMQHILNGTQIDENLEIDAFTPHFGITVEKNGGEEGVFSVSNVDFGIVERARYKVQIDKTIKRIQLIQPDGSILRDFMNFNNLPANTKAIRTSSNDRKNRLILSITRGFVQFEIDKELLQNTTLLIEYEFTATNISEKDYKEAKYYKYGIEPSDAYLVRLSVANIIDYVDNGLKYEANGHMISEGNTETKNKDNKWAEIELNKDENKKYISDEVNRKLYLTGKCAYNTVLLGKGLDIEDKTKMLAPGESNSTTLLLNKALDIDKEEMNYCNLAEIVEIKKTWGREIYMQDTTNTYGETIGNLDPTQPIEDIVKNVREPDTHYSEKIVINPPTGANRNYTIYAILGLTCIAILSTGIILIKKKIL